MSPILLVLLSGLTLFGASIMEPTEEVSEEEDVSLDDIDVEGGSNPLDEALAMAELEEDIDDTGNDVSDEEGDDVTDEIEDEPVDPDSDTITGSENDDLIEAEAGDDVVDGGEGDDTILGGEGADTIEGGLGNDNIFGALVDGLDDAAQDILSGGDGDDEITLGDDDIATGGEGADTFVRASTVTEAVTVTDFDSAEDVLVVHHESDTAPSIETQVVSAEGGVTLILSDGSEIMLEGLDAAIDESLLSFVDIRES